ncbi:MAG: hypothetical protein ABMA13_20200 [Chthoniobacteraceae bacterium]
MSEPAVYEESVTSAAIDGVRIGCVTAAALVSLDQSLPDEVKIAILDSLDQARAR